MDIVKQIESIGECMIHLILSIQDCNEKKIANMKLEIENTIHGWID